MEKLPIWKPLLSLKHKDAGPLHLTSLIQWQTYEYLMEGYPTPDINEVIAQTFFKSAVTFYGLEDSQERGTYYIEADPLPIEIEDGGALGDEQHLPIITCAGRFFSENAVEGKDYSQLIILWHQSSPALPIEEEILNTIQCLVWSRHAQDMDY